MLEATITKKLRDFTLDLSIRVNPGEIFVLMGTNGSGKSTTLNLIAGLLHPDSGSVRLNGEDVSMSIRDPRISDGASKVSKVSGVRRALVAKQRVYAERASVVMEGRDIGTVVFPDAQVKIYLDADAIVRARRRQKDLEAQGTFKPVSDLVDEIRERDERDSTRADSPLRQAEDAVYVDSSALSPGEVEEEILRIVRARVTNGKELH